MDTLHHRHRRLSTVFAFLVLAAALGESNEIPFLLCLWLFELPYLCFLGSLSAYFTELFG